ncbi:MAG: hypothetical protein RDU83_12895 [bacterium]|nr:hypothetical protein [bacterium]
MEGQVVARFLVDHPFRSGTVRAILDTLVAQGGAYEPHLVRRLPEDSLRRIIPARPVRLLDDAEEGGTQSTFLRVSEGLMRPVLTLSVSEVPRSRPSMVTLTMPREALVTSKDIEQVLGVCKGLYLFLEAPWGTAGVDDPPDLTYLGWANFFGPEIVARLGPARLLTSMAFIVEILPDGGMMLVTHASPDLAAEPGARSLRRQIEEALDLRDCLGAVLGDKVLDRGVLARTPRVRRKPPSPRP